MCVTACVNMSYDLFNSEYLLFHDEDEVPASYETSIITTMAHELSHMWFGNLVTCEWWEYIWLNEGFAEYMQWHISDRVL